MENILTFLFSKWKSIQLISILFMRSVCSFLVIYRTIFSILKNHWSPRSVKIAGFIFLYGVVHLSLFFRYLGAHGALFGFVVWRVWFTKCVLLGVCIWIYVNEFSIALLGIAGDWCGAKWGIVVILKALIISSSEILETGSELNRTSSELIWRSSEENVTIGEIIWTWCQVVTK